MATQEYGSQSEVILEVATRLFAALGYDGTSIRQIADATGLDITTITEQVGLKRDVYLAVMERAFQAERAAIESAAAEFEATGSVHRLFDRCLDFYIEHPDIVALWIHRWLLDAADVAELENQYVEPLTGLIGKSVGNLLPDTDIDIEYTLWTVIWAVHGFVKGGAMEADGQVQWPSNPQSLRRFRRTIHQMLHRHLGLPGDPPL
ncbi:hypothetical protein Pth03_04520 [Planotetraspora thailandica]|uniref:HTH tetR-type domain-containing protein n=1 Tax=Planotetraspora thailandica TaxID=487172 RepID=A0A8J3UU52_9ACTN|nr:TetR/AcrR family transcriptional regulator [Planotetraspora thailandica]GII52063.1 hypothetical protein Pth03_04520 [Planotetraspora thailandica]